MSLEEAPFLNLHEGALWAGPPYRALPSSSCLPGDRVESNSGVLASPGPPAPPRVLTFAGEVLDGHVLDGNLLEEERLLAPGVPADDPPLPQPLAQPGQVAVAVEGVRQEVSGRREGPSLGGYASPGGAGPGTLPCNPGAQLSSGQAQGRRKEVWGRECRLF